MTFDFGCGFLFQTIQAKETDDQVNRESTLAAAEQIETFQKLEVELRGQISKVEKLKDEEINILRKDLAAAERKVCAECFKFPLLAKLEVALNPM